MTRFVFSSPGRPPKGRRAGPPVPGTAAADNEVEDVRSCGCRHVYACDDYFTGPAAVFGGSVGRNGIPPTDLRQPKRRLGDGAYASDLGAPSLTFRQSE
jgi:hypothetical protein